VKSKNALKKTNYSCCATEQELPVFWQ